MWYYHGKPFTSSMILDHVGFVYLITNTETGKKYVGKKKFWNTFTRPPLKGKTRKRKEIRESDWMTYCGSNHETIALAESRGLDIFKREILHLCKSLGAMSYLELKEQVDREVLLRDDYYNGIIQARINRTHVKSLAK